jgi:hypothetical protein
VFSCGSIISRVYTLWLTDYRRWRCISSGDNSFGKFYFVHPSTYRTTDVTDSNWPISWPQCHRHRISGLRVLYIIVSHPLVRGPLVVRSLCLRDPRVEFFYSFIYFLCCIAVSFKLFITFLLLPHWSRKHDGKLFLLSSVLVSLHSEDDCLLGCCVVLSRRSLPTFQKSAVMMEAASTSEMTVNFYQTTRHITPDDSNFHTRRRENLKSHPVYFLFYQNV